MNLLARCLSADERLQLIEELWESLDQDDIPLTEEQRANSTAGSPSTK
jgi:putative addiction module component (TIGR02574 family)